MEQLRERGKCQVVVIIPQEIADAIDAEAKRKHLRRGTYLAQFLCIHGVTLMRKNKRTAA